MTVDVDSDNCIECGACAQLCPEVFQMDDRIGKARVVVFEVTEKSSIEEAITTCPTRCISWKD